MCVSLIISICCCFLSHKLVVFQTMFDVKTTQERSWKLQIIWGLKQNRKTHFVDWSHQRLHQSVSFIKLKVYRVERTICLTCSSLMIFVLAYNTDQKLALLCKINANFVGVVLIELASHLITFSMHPVLLILKLGFSEGFHKFTDFYSHHFSLDERQDCICTCLDSDHFFNNFSKSTLNSHKND